MKKLLLVILIAALHSTTSFAINGNIIHVARKLRMSYLEPNPPKDYYFDLGERNGVKTGDIVEVYRMVPVINSMSGGAWHLMKIVLGELKVIFVGESTSIGRIEKEREPQSLPAVEYQGFMLGDEVQFKEVKLPFSKN